MAKTHIVQEGESPSQIAALYGFEDWATIYQHADNADLRKARPTSGLVFPGDVVIIPPREPKVFRLATGKRHRIVITMPKSKLKVVVKDHTAEPLSGKSFELYCPGKAEPIEGSTTGEGVVECKIPLGIKSAQLVVWEQSDKTGTRYVWNLDFGTLSSPDTQRGVRQRLMNLGYYVGLETDETNRTEEDKVEDDIESDTIDHDAEASAKAPSPLCMAVAAFQEDMGLPITGEIDEATREKLTEAHGGA